MKRLIFVWQNMLYNFWKISHRPQVYQNRKRKRTARILSVLSFCLSNCRQNDRYIYLCIYMAVLFLFLSFWLSHYKFLFAQTLNLIVLMVRIAPHSTLSIIYFCVYVPIYLSILLWPYRCSGILVVYDYFLYIYVCVNVCSKYIHIKATQKIKPTLACGQVLYV